PSMIRPSLQTLALAVLLCLCGGARGDVIYQPGGGKIVGEIVEERDDYVAIRTRAGVQKVPRDEIDKIEKGKVELPPAAPPAAPRPVEKPPAPKPVEKPAAAPKPGAATGPAVSAGPLAYDEEALVRPRQRAVVDWFERHRSDLRVKLAPLLAQRRKEALDFIRDPRRYPEENHGAAAQPEVDRLVGLLRLVWEDPFGFAVEASSELHRLFGEYSDVADDATIAELRARVNRALSFRDAPAADERMVEEARQVLAFNAKVKTSIDPEERACIDATNRYRMMYGLRPLRIDERLVQAARKHSKAMVELHFFDHTSPLKGLETPDKRCAAEGASYSAENIAFGSIQGEATFEQWYTSSGHHRNILADHLSIGIGRHETYWTQDFGKDVPKQ
ncbi:MAG TPA: CAP domain-containing protein, partial [Planctomycetota bacterium]|nr:CAP domain-containing protein [Planctomycetota bacterium]